MMSSQENSKTFPVVLTNWLTPSPDLFRYKFFKTTTTTNTTATTTTTMMTTTSGTNITTTASPTSINVGSYSGTTTITTTAASEDELLHPRVIASKSEMGRDKYQWVYQFRFHKASCTKEASCKTGCATLKAGDVVKLELYKGRSLIIKLEKAKNAAVAAVAASAASTGGAGGASSNSGSTSNSGTSTPTAPSPRKKRNSHRREKSVVVCSIVDNTTGVVFGQTSKAHATLFVGRRQPQFFTDLWLPSRCPHISLPRPAEEFKNITEQNYSSFTIDHWQQHFGFTQFHSILLYEQYTDGFSPHWTSLYRVLASKRPSTTPLLISAHNAPSLEYRQQQLQSQQQPSSPSSSSLPPSLSSSPSQPVQPFNQPIIMAGENLHIPCIVVFQNNTTSFAVSPRKNFYSSLTVDTSHTWPPGLYEVYIGTTMKLKMYQKSFIVSINEDYPSSVAAMATIKKKTPVQQQESNNHLKSERSTEKLPSQREEKTNRKEGKSRKKKTKAHEPKVDIDEPRNISFLSKNGTINLNYSIVLGDETYPLLSFFIHLILPFFGRNEGLWCSLFSNSEAVLTLKNLALVNRAFLRYVLRVRAYQRQYSEITKKFSKINIWRSLQYCCSFGDFRTLTKTVQYLSSLDHPLTPEKQMPEVGPTGFIYSLVQGHTQIFQFLFRKFPKVASIFTLDGVTPLHIGAQHSRNSFIKYLLQQINCETKSTKETPLYNAILSGSQSTINQLIMYGADKKRVNYLQQKPEDLLQLMMYSNLNLNANPLPQDQISKLTAKISTAHLMPPERRSFSFDGFTLKQKLGEGAFGEVYLAVDKLTGKEVALKQMVKSVILSRGKKDHVDNEKRLLQKAEEKKMKFLVHLYAAFQDRNILYLAMDYCPGGDLREFLAAIQVLSEDEARLWFAEMIMAVYSLHELGYIHRDIKPANFFIDAQGHIKLGDFGLSKLAAYVKHHETEVERRNKLNYSLVGSLQGKQREILTIDNFQRRFFSNQAIDSIRRSARTKWIEVHSVVGSPEYMSPEVVRNRIDPTDESITETPSSYGWEVDWWSLGCVFFECILGAPPFTGETVEDIFRDINHWDEIVPQLLDQYKTEMSEGCYLLLKGFLAEPTKRLGNDLTLICTQIFFVGLDWTNLDKMPAPYVPKVNDEK